MLRTRVLDVNTDEQANVSHCCRFLIDIEELQCVCRIDLRMHLRIMLLSLLL